MFFLQSDKDLSYLISSVCQIAWFDCCVSVPSNGIERQNICRISNFSKIKNCTKNHCSKMKREKRFVGADLDAFYYEVFQ